MFGPALAMERIPGPVCLSWKFSSLKFLKTELFVRSYLEFVSVDRFATSTVVVGEVTALKKKRVSIDNLSKVLTWHMNWGMTRWKDDPL